MRTATLTRPADVDTIRCGNCRHRHDNIDAIRACCNGTLETCDWLVDTREYDEDGGKIILPCGADSYPLPGDRGVTCARGHEHIWMEVAAREGLAYVTADEAPGFMRNNPGMTALLMDGSPWRG